MPSGGKYIQTNRGYICAKCKGRKHVMCDRCCGGLRIDCSKCNGKGKIEDNICDKCENKGTSLCTKCIPLYNHGYSLGVIPCYACEEDDKLCKCTIL